MRTIHPRIPVRIALVVLSTSGCVGLPYISPPLQVGVGTGGRSSSAKEGGDVPLSMRIGAYPMGFGEGWLGRSFDFGGGYIIESGKSRVIEGGYFEGGYAFVRGPLGSRAWGRMLARAQLRVLKPTDDPRFGVGGALQINAELVTYAEGPIAAVGKNGGLIGWAFGETGIGLYAEGAYARFPSFDTFAVTVGLQVRLPASAGFLWVWAWKLK